MRDIADMLLNHSSKDFLNLSSPYKRIKSEDDEVLGSFKDSRLSFHPDNSQGHQVSVGIFFKYLFSPSFLHLNIYMYDIYNNEFDTEPI